MCVTFAHFSDCVLRRLLFLIDFSRYVDLSDRLNDKVDELIDQKQEVLTALARACGTLGLCVGTCACALR